MTKKHLYWAGYIDGKIDDDMWGETYLPRSLAIFRTRKEAKESYEDVRRVRVVEVKNALR